MISSWPSNVPTSCLLTQPLVWYITTGALQGAIMRTVIEIDSRTADRLRELADSKHISVDELLAAHLPGLNDTAPEQTVAGEEKVKAFDEWVRGFPANTPFLSDADIHRGSIYRD